MRRNFKAKPAELMQAAISFNADPIMIFKHQQTLEGLLLALDLALSSLLLPSFSLPVLPLLDSSSADSSASASARRRLSFSLSRSFSRSFSLRSLPFLALDFSP